MMRVLDRESIDKSSIEFNPRGAQYEHELTFKVKGGQRYKIKGWKAIYALVNTLFPKDPIPKRKLKNLALSGDTFFAEDVRNFLMESNVNTIMLYGQNVSKIPSSVFKVDNITGYSSLIDEYFVKSLINQCEDVVKSSTYNYPHNVSIGHDMIKYSSGMKMIPSVKVTILDFNKLVARIFKNRIEIIIRVKMRDNKSYARPPKVVIYSDDLQYGTFSTVIRKQLNFLLDAIFRTSYKIDKQEYICTNDSKLSEKEKVDLELDNYIAWSRGE